MGDDGLQLPLGFDDTEARSDLTRIRAWMQQAGQQIGDAFSKAADGGLDKYVKKVAEKRREERADAANARFLAHELGEIIPMSKGASAAVGGMSDALIGIATAGGGMMLALEAAKLLGKGIAILGEELEGNATKAQKFGEDTAKMLGELSKEWDGFYKTLADKEQLQSETLGKEQIKRLNMRMIEARQALADAQAERKRLERSDDLFDKAKLAAMKAYNGTKLALGMESADAEQQLQHNLSVAVAAIKTAQSRMEVGVVEETEHKKSEARKKGAEKQKNDDASYAKSRVEMLARFEQQGLSDREQLILRATAEMRKIRDSDHELQTAAAEALQRELDAFDRKRVDEEEKRAAEHASKTADEARRGVEARLAVEREGELLREVNGDEALAKEILALEQAYTEKLAVVVDNEEEYTRRVAEYALKRSALLKKQNSIDNKLLSDFGSMAREVYGQMSSQVVQAFGHMIRQSARYEEAIKAAGDAQAETAEESDAAMAAQVQSVLAGIAEMAATRALFELAEGTAIEAAALMGNPIAGASSALHFASAAMFAAIAAGTGAGAYAIGQNRGLTHAENQQLKDAQERRDQEAKRTLESGSGGSGNYDPKTTTYASGVPLKRRDDERDYRWGMEPAPSGSTGGSREGGAATTERAPVNVTQVVVQSEFGETAAQAAMRGARAVKLARALNMDLGDEAIVRRAVRASR